MLVYHSSDQRFTSPDVLHSRNALDFGKGFYVTRFKEQAEKYAQRFIRAGNNAYLHIFDYTPDASLKIKEFNAYDADWLDFVCSCRSGKSDYLKYDIIEGGVANDKVFQTVDLYMADVFNREQALQKRVYEMSNNQLCFITQKAIDNCLKFIEYQEYTNG